MNIPFNKITIIFFIIINVLHGVSAPPYAFEIEQLDGRKLLAKMHGHEYYNWIETIDGYVIQQNDDKSWCYSKLNNDGKYVSSNILVTYPAPVDLGIPRHLKEVSPKLRKLSHNHIEKMPMSDTLSRVDFSDETLKPLVMLVDFNDEEHEYTASQFEHLFFAENLSPVSAGFPSNHSDYTMSVRDYYDEISNGKQQIVGDAGSVIDWQRAKNNYSYYVDGSQGTGEGANGISRSVASLIVEIAMQVNEEGFDFSEFDNGVGAIDVVILVVAGKGGQSSNYFWPHMFVVPSTASGLDLIDPSAPVNSLGYFSIDGVVINKYIVIQEKYAWNHSGAEINMIHPIGTICHELGHILGLPDLYDTSENSFSGIGEWGLMGSGNWQNQTSPAYMSAWSRYRLGYIDPLVIEDVNETMVDILPAEIHGDGVAYLLPMNSKIPQEYILLENRQKLGSDIFLPGSGLLVWHIDEIVTDMYPALNSVNVNPDFYGVNLLQADGLGELYTSSGSADSSDPFKSGDGPLNGTTNPNTDLYDYDRDADGMIDSGGESNIEISNISINSEDIISFIVSNPNKNGQVLSYDEGNFEGTAFSKVPGLLEWGGIRFVSPSASLLSGIQMALPPSNLVNSNVSNYSLNIWNGWNGNKPDSLLLSLNGSSVNWNSLTMRDGGFAFLSLVDQNIMLERGGEYYFEINYEGMGHVYFFDRGHYSNNQSNGNSYFRSNIHEECTALSSINEAGNGDWNLRVVLSGENCGDGNGEIVWPGDTNGDMKVDANDIVPIGIYFRHQGCQRNGPAYAWEEMQLPSGWSSDAASRSDANGDGMVGIADILVILVNWDKVSTDAFMRIEDSDSLEGIDLEEYRDNFHEIYLSMSGSSDAEISIRSKLEEIFGFSILPSKFILGNNFPNPFNSRTVIPYFIPNEGMVHMEIHDILGRKIKEFNNQHEGEGWHEVVFDTDELSSGIYFYALKKENDIVARKKMILLK